MGKRIDWSLLEKYPGIYLDAVPLSFIDCDRELGEFSLMVFYFTSLYAFPFALGLCESKSDEDLNAFCLAVYGSF